MRTSKVTVVDLDDGDRLDVKVKDVIIHIRMGYNTGGSIISVLRPVSDSRSLKAILSTVDNGSPVVLEDSRDRAKVFQDIKQVDIETVG